MQSLAYRLLGVLFIAIVSLFGFSPKMFPVAYAQSTLSADINGDGKIDFTDMRLILSGWLGQSLCNLPGTPTYNCDIFPDSKVNALDAALVFAHWATALPSPSPVLGTIYYVATDGRDTNDGKTLSTPWKTVGHALLALQAGDQLNLRGGTYFENNITTPVTGTLAKPITIQSYPGEQATIDGGTSTYLTTNVGNWIPCNGSNCPSGINEYVSASPMPISNTIAKAWLVDNNMQIYRYCTVADAVSNKNCNSADMESTNNTLNLANPTYFGPGINLRSDHHLYIRLSPDLSDPNSDPVPLTPADTDPNHNRIVVSTSDSLGTNIVFKNKMQYVNFSNLTIAHAVTLLSLQSGSQFLVFRGCTFLYGTYGLNYGTNVSNIEIASSNFDGQHPWYMYWTDVKNANSSTTEVAEAYPDFQSGAIGGIAQNTNLHDSIIQNGMDGVGFSDGNNLIVKNNQFINLHDDAANFFRNACGEVSHNFFWHVDSGFAILPSTQNFPRCSLYIHHNVFDNTSLRRGGRPNNYRKQDWPVLNTDTPFAKHTTGYKDAGWKVYNNTFLSRYVPYHTPMNPYSLNTDPSNAYVNNPDFAVVNNVFYAIDNRLIFRDHLVINGGMYDGNDVFQVAPQNGSYLFQNFGDGGNYTSLDAFKAKNTGWEANGLQVDPGFNMAVINDPSYNYPAILSRYYPTNRSLLGNVGYSYSGNGINWPETSGVNYIGAFPPQ